MNKRGSEIKELRNSNPEIVIKDENGNLILQLACRQSRHDGCTMNNFDGEDIGYK